MKGYSWNVCDFLVNVVEILLIIVVLGIIIGIISTPLARITNYSRISTFKATNITLQTARNNKTISPYEIVAIQQEVIKANKWLAEIQYYNNTIFDWWIPDEVNTLKPIE